MKRAIRGFVDPTRKLVCSMAGDAFLADDACEHDVWCAVTVAALQAKMTVVQNQFFASVGAVTAFAFLISVLLGAF
jgi:hypothetical protein